MKKSLIAGLIGITVFSMTNAHADPVIHDGDHVVTGQAYVAGGLTAKSNLAVEGAVAINGEDGLTINNGGLKVSEGIVAGGNLAVEGGADIKGENGLTVYENADIKGGLDVGTNVIATGDVYTSQSSINQNWTKIQDVESRLSSVDGRLSGVEKRLSDVKKTSYRGIAAVTAIANIPTVEQGKRFAVGVGVGNFEGENALAIGASIRANDSLTFKASAGKSGSSATYGAGAALSF